jgi:hypothetical protein
LISDLRVREWALDDLSVHVAVYHWTEVLERAYRIVIHREGQEVFGYEPMKSDIVSGRVGQMKRFYEDGCSQLDRRTPTRAAVPRNRRLPAPNRGR